MKNCPVCKSVVDEEFECPICWTTLTYEPNCHATQEKFVPSKFLVRYLLRQCWFSLIALLVVFVATFFTNEGTLRICLLAWFAAIFSCLMGAFQRKWVCWLLCKYSEEYASFRVELGKYLAAGAAIFAAIMMVALSFDLR